MTEINLKEYIKNHSPEEIITKRLLVEPKPLSLPPTWCKPTRRLVEVLLLEVSPKGKIKMEIKSGQRRGIICWESPLDWIVYEELPYKKEVDKT